MTFEHEKRFPPVVWALVADRGQARILAAPWPEAKDWQEVETLQHAEGRQPQREAETDGPGTFSASGGGGHHAGQKQTDHKHQTAERFAAEVVQRLERGRQGNEFGRLAVVAPPLFLGVLRNKLPAPLKELVVHEADKDHTGTPLRELSGILSDALAGA